MSVRGCVLSTQEHTLLVEALYVVLSFWESWLVLWLAVGTMANETMVRWNQSAKVHICDPTQQKQSLVATGRPELFQDVKWASWNGRISCFNNANTFTLWMNRVSIHPLHWLRMLLLRRCIHVSTSNIHHPCVKSTIISISVMSAQATDQQISVLGLLKVWQITSQRK